MERVDLGQSLRAIRKQKNITLQNLSKKANCSVNYLSQLERGLNSPTIETLMRITDALDIRLNDLFSGKLDNGRPKVIHQKKRKSFIQNFAGVTYYSLCASNQQDLIDAFIIELEPEASTGVTPHKEKGTEFLFILNGKIDLNYNGHTLSMSSGDSICFDSQKPHHLKNLGPENAEVISVATPQRY